jgi:hypothetical protein
VTLEENVVTVHPTSERDPIPLALHHFPICSTFAFFKPTNNQSSSSIASKTFDENGEKLDAPAKKCDRIVVCDPNHTEEAIMDGKLVLGMNPYKEICTLHLAGKMIIDKAFVVGLAHKAVDHAKDTADRLKNALARDELARKETAASRESSGQTPDIGLASILKNGSIGSNQSNTELAKKIMRIDTEIHERVKDKERLNFESVDNDSKFQKDHQISTDGRVVTMVEQMSDNGDSLDEEEIQAVKAVSAEEKRKERILAEIEVDDDSEEELTTTVRTKDLSAPVPD